MYERLNRLYEAGTTKPWLYCGGIVHTPDPSRIVLGRKSVREWAVCAIRWVTSAAHRRECEADGEWIAGARNAWPAMMTERKVLVCALERCYEALSDVQAQVRGASCRQDVEFALRDASKALRVIKEAPND